KHGRTADQASLPCLDTPKLCFCPQHIRVLKARAGMPRSREPDEMRNGLRGTQSWLPSPAAAPRLSLQEQATPLQPGLMAPQPSSLHTSFRALSITRIEIKESVIYTAEGDRSGK